jgi:hypothetical protein
MSDTLKRALEGLAAIGALAPGWAADGKPRLEDRRPEVEPLRPRLEASRKAGSHRETGFGTHCPGPAYCGGCYLVGVIDGRERFIHPPKVSQEWTAWLQKWEPKGARVQ